MLKTSKMLKNFIAGTTVAAMIYPSFVSAGMYYDSRYFDYYSISTNQAFGQNAIPFGNWYDLKGNLVLTIGKDYSINGCKIISVGYIGDTVSFYKIKIMEDNGYREIYLHPFGSYEGYHEILVFNDKTPLRKTKEPQYFESIGGIYLGMDKDEVVKKYGQPSNMEDTNHSITLNYKNEGFSVDIQCGVVSGIKLYKNSNKKFDRSGLSANSSKAEFEFKYNENVSRRGNINIGNGEVISLRSDDYIWFGFFTTGYVY